LADCSQYKGRRHRRDMYDVDVTADAIVAVSNSLQLRGPALLAGRRTQLMFMMSKVSGASFGLMHAIARRRTPSELQRQYRK